MEDLSPSYKTIEGIKTSEFEEERSVFISSAKHVLSEEEALDFLEEIREKYKDATHSCYAYIIGGEVPIKRYSDAGEPQGTAGLPILSVIEKAGLTNIIIIVTRYFGGKLLGKGGLVRAYSRGAADIVKAYSLKKSPFYIVEMSFSYKLLGIIENYLAEGRVEIIDKAYLEEVTFTVYLSEEDFKRVRDELTDLTSGQIKIKISDGVMRFIK